jgi:hypothetical protein
MDDQPLHPAVRGLKTISCTPDVQEMLAEHAPPEAPPSAQHTPSGAWWVRQE